MEVHLEASEAGTRAGAGAQVQVRRSQRRVKYRPSRWRMHQWEVRAGAGGVVCRAAALRTGGGGLLLWVGGEGQPQLGAVALAVPAERANGAGGGGGVCSVLSGAGGEGQGCADSGAALARRLASALHRPVHVCCALAFDRFTAPLVERGIIAEIKGRPECFLPTD